MVKPLFVLGLNRNGTTWIQNILCNHPEIVGAQHKAHWGATESNICSHILYWGNFSNNDQFVKFLELYSSADYFKIVKGDKNYFYQNRPKDFTDFYFELMDNYTRPQGVKYWVTKLDPLFYQYPGMLEDFCQRAGYRYNKVKFISIKRQYNKVLESSLNRQSASKNRKSFGRRELYTVKHAIGYANGYKLINNIISERGGLSIRFNQLKKERSKAIEKITKYLRIDYSEKMMEDRFPANSSYKATEEKITLPWWEMVIAKLLVPVIQQLDLLIKIMFKLRNSFRRAEECPLWWRLRKLENLEKDLKRELENDGQVGLKQMLFESDD